MSPFCSALHSHFKKIEPSKSLVSIQRTRKKEEKKAYLGPKQRERHVVWACFRHHLLLLSPDAAAAVSVVVRHVMVMVVVGTVVEVMVDMF